MVNKKRSNKYPIEWHLDCINNQKSYIESQKKKMEEIQKDITRVEENIRFEEYQIELARKGGLSEFDREKLGVKRGKED